MWNGDNKATVWAFRLSYFRDSMKLNPDFVLKDGEKMDKYYSTLGCVDDVYGEDFEFWY